MKKVLKLKSELSTLLGKSDRLYVAVGLMSEYGLDFIQEHASANCEIRLLVGIDLPTPSNVFKQLLEEEELHIETKVYNHPKQFFHPKVYLVQQQNQWYAFVGSGNFTGGGFETNLEMSLAFADEETCEGLLKWFNAYFKLGTPLSEDWVTEYDLFYKARQKYLSRDKNDVINFKRRTSKQAKKDKKLEDYDLTVQFFNYEHHNAFSGNKPYVSTPEAVNERTLVRTRLLELHDRLWPLINQKNWNVHHHHKVEYITSSVEHSLYTDATLHALWLHYGRSKEELKRFKAVYGENQSSMYHMRLQILVHELNISTWLTVGKNGGGVVDREAFKRRIKNNKQGFHERFFSLLTNLSEAFYIIINDVEKKANEFESAEQCYEFVIQDNIHSHYFIIGREYEPDDPKISERNIVATVLEDFGELQPLYQLIRTEPPKPI